MKKSDCCHRTTGDRDLAHACWVHLVGEDGELRLAASWECDDAPSLLFLQLTKHG